MTRQNQINEMKGGKRPPNVHLQNLQEMAGSLKKKLNIKARHSIYIKLASHFKEQASKSVSKDNVEGLYKKAKELMGGKSTSELKELFEKMKVQMKAKSAENKAKRAAKKAKKAAKLAAQQG